jgi:hypothetical protein
MSARTGATGISARTVAGRMPAEAEAVRGSGNVGTNTARDLAGGE